MCEEWCITPFCALGSYFQQAWTGPDNKAKPRNLREPFTGASIVILTLKSYVHHLDHVHVYFWFRTTKKEIPLVRPVLFFPYAFVLLFIRSKRQCALRRYIGRYSSPDSQWVFHKYHVLPVRTGLKRLKPIWLLLFCSAKLKRNWAVVREPELETNQWNIRVDSIVCAIALCTLHSIALCARLCRLYSLKIGNYFRIHVLRVYEEGHSGQ